MRCCCRDDSEDDVDVDIGIDVDGVENAITEYPYSSHGDNEKRTEIRTRSENRCRCVY